VTERTLPPSSRPPVVDSPGNPRAAIDATRRSIGGPRPALALVVAAAENGVIGRAKQLPWHLPADLQHFKAVTMGKPMLMGRRTFESIGKALPGRRSLVLTRDESFTASGVERVASVAEAIERAREVPELAVIGGGEVFRLCLPLADRVYFTRVHASVAGDARFPELDPKEWHCVERIARPADEKNAYAMTFFLLERTLAPDQASL